MKKMIELTKTQSNETLLYSYELLCLKNWLQLSQEERMMKAVIIDELLDRGILRYNEEIEEYEMAV